MLLPLARSLFPVKQIYYIYVTTRACLAILPHVTNETILTKMN